MRTHGALTESSVSAHHATHDRKGREGKGDRKGREERHPFIASNWVSNDDQRATARLVPGMNAGSTC